MYNRTITVEGPTVEKEFSFDGSRGPFEGVGNCCGRSSKELGRPYNVVSFISSK